MSRLATTIILTLVVTVSIVNDALSINVNNVNKKCQCGIENKVQTTHKESKKVGRRIIGGRKVTAGKYPWMVLVANSMSQCTGAIINDKFVLTAAHCVTGANEMKVYHDGKHTTPYFMVRGTPLKVKDVSKEGDIALLELEKRLNFTKTFSPICLTPQIKHDNYFAAGWGIKAAPKVVNGQLDFSHVWKMGRDLAEIPLVHLTDKECSEMGKPVEYQICVRGLNNNSNLCDGDSGGPLMTRGKDGRVSTLGVASASDCNTTKDKAATYEKTIRRKNWIKDHTKDAIWCQGSSSFFA